MTVLVHMSDLHIDDGERSRSRARAAVEFVRGLPGPISAVLVTGDIADHGDPDEYRFAKDLLDTIELPVLLCPGNHDVRGPYRAVLLDGPSLDDPINRVHHVEGVTYVMCDSSIPGQDDGYLTDETVEWLDRVLREAAGEPAFVCFHHPPGELASPFIDRVRQFETERLEAVVRAHEHVRAVLCGHAHTPATSSFAGRPVLVAPGVVSTLRFPWEGADGFDKSMPPAVAFHVLHDDGRTTTHFRLVPPGS